MKKLFFAKKENLLLSFLFICCVIGALAIYFSISFIQENQYKALSESLLQGKLTVDVNKLVVGSNDTTFFNGNYYIYFGPTPALLLIPFHYLFPHVTQQVLGIVFFMYIFIVVYKLAQQLKLKRPDALWMAIFFTFGTVLLNLTVVNITAYQVQVIATAFILFAIYEFYTRKRWLLIGCLIALAATTRLTLILSVVFFLLHLLFDRETTHKVKKIVYLASPIALAIIILGVYNFARFGNPLNSGYSMNAEFPPDLLALIAKHGLFSYEYIPGNLYYLFFKGPDPVFSTVSKYLFTYPFLKADNWGLGIFFTSPLFLYLFSKSLKNKNILICWITSLFLMIPVLTYFGIGSWQYGYRYALDIYPFLFLILCDVFRNGLPVKAKSLIIYSILFNYYLMLSVWNVYPF